MNENLFNEFLHWTKNTIPSPYEIEFFANAFHDANKTTKFSMAWTISWLNIKEDF